MTSSSLLSSQLAHAALAMFLGATVGCNDGGPSMATRPHGPHGGHIAEMPEGAGFGVELTLDEKRRRMVIYVHESGVPNPHPLLGDSLSGHFEAEGRSTAVTFSADPRPDDPRGHASRFVLALDTLPQQLLASDQFVLRLSYAADGETITASIPHKNNHVHEYRHD